MDAFRLYFCSADADARRHVDRWIRRATAIKYHPLVLYIRDCCWPLQYQFPCVDGTLHRLRRLELLFFLLLKLDRSFAELLHSGCPVLEDLVLVGCHISWHSIQFTEEHLGKCLSEDADTLIIRAPCLASLRLYFPYHGYGNGVSLDMNRTFFFAECPKHLAKPLLHSANFTWR